MFVRSPNINVMIKAAEKAGRGLVRDFGEVEQLQVSKKGPADFVSTADKRAEETIRRELEKARPEYGFLLEEAGVVKGSDEDYRWIVDPLDGTTNFLHGIPHFAISIALEEKGEIVAGVIYDPVKDEMFWAEKGKGAFVNDRRLRVSARTRLSESIFATGIPFMGRDTEDDGHGLFLRRLEKIMEKTAGVRRFGAASLDLAYVAAGRYDGFWERGLAPWDVAAGVLLVKEAGGFATDAQGRAFSFKRADVVTANEKIHKSLLDVLRSAK
ncbi:inositol monophosphatase family protein [Curvivirga sp.]|uniref:inositol monophosphatase family protein n=1 Tax=Curvivirga sp. TaxID=2856848 RepID=UPI003B5A797A